MVGLALKGAAALSDAVLDSAALHALTIGAIGTMLLAVMSRAALGHTGRPLRAHAPTVGAYVLISVAAVLRLAAALIPKGECHAGCRFVSGLFARQCRWP